MSPKRRALAGVAQAYRLKAKRGRASSIAASGPALPDPTPPVWEAVIDNIADRVSAPVTGQLPPATGPVPKVQTRTAPRMYHSPDSVTAQVQLEAAAARLTGNQ